ncbi:MAG: hypothetical protein AVDCRST_MAG21-1109 [uncultured Nocardioidaceae bacterium]|uniref:Uncharacterized protein n=1 Tax=uncultured Nocardioidaceae bacterium TaxID=253824 RepID=A0A6J4MYA8_9ACTN|nr:MAG: hypothetical protein AVDCRST_MAG21-1109 [uncultured Nocardioidaceae bacterium]
MIKRRFLTTGLTLGLAASGLSVTALTTATVAQAEAIVEGTQFAMSTSGFGSRLNGGTVPVGSGNSAFEVIACTNKAGLSRENHEAEVKVPGLATLSGVKTEVRTIKTGDMVEARSRHTIASATLADTSAGVLELRNIVSESRAFHDAQGFHGTTTTELGSITLAGNPIAVPAPGETVTVQGVAEITLDNSTTSENADGASAKADAVRVDLLATGTKLFLAHSRARIDDGIVSGVFTGSSWASQSQAVDGTATTGRTPYQVMPCQGLDGETKNRSITRANLDDAVVARTLTTQHFSQQSATVAKGYTQGAVGRVAVNSSELVIEGVVGRANVTRTSDGVTSTIRGSTIGEIRLNGETVRIPRSGVLKIPGVAKLERNVVTRFSNGIFVTALRLTVLEPNGAVMNLGNAKLRIRGL